MQPDLVQAKHALDLMSQAAIAHIPDTADGYEQGERLNADALWLMESIGFKFEDDRDLMDYCIKATPPECCAATIASFIRWLSNQPTIPG